MIVDLTAFLTLTWAFSCNQFVGKIIISPFLICSFTHLLEMLFILIEKEKIAHIFKYIFRISFFIYIFGFLVYAIYDAISNKRYSSFIIIGIFIIVAFRILKAAFKKNL